MAAVINQKMVSAIDQSLETKDNILMSEKKDVTVDGISLLEKKFNLPLEKLYNLSLKYYRDKERNGELIIPYNKRLLFMAYAKQIKVGPYSQSSDEAGWFDLVGNDRTNAWKSLGDLSASDAMSSFVTLLDSICPPFRDFVSEFVENELKQEQKQKQQQSEENAEKLATKPTVPSAHDLERFESQRRQIQEALNQQTYHQFRAYAQQQFVGDPVQQEALIKQLQEQHYQQYMAQVYDQQAKLAGVSPEGDINSVNGNNTNGVKTSSSNSQGNDVRAKRNSGDNESNVSEDDGGDELPSNPAIAPASMWNRQDIVEFKNTIRKEGAEGIIKVGHGETVTVRVPTHEEGTCLFWEFATDSYDIGFGVFFEWTIADSNQVSVQISESSDEEGEEELQQGSMNPEGDIESGSPAVENAKDLNKPHVDEIVPVYRRDCHEEVYAGSHVYPGRGVYLLKFDNSYSLWRSKTLYYRVYYSK